MYVDTWDFIFIKWTCLMSISRPLGDWLRRIEGASGCRLGTPSFNQNGNSCAFTDKIAEVPLPLWLSRKWITLFGVLICRAPRILQGWFRNICAQIRAYEYSNWQVWLGFLTLIAGMPKPEKAEISSGDILKSTSFSLVPQWHLGLPKVCQTHVAYIPAKQSIGRLVGALSHPCPLSKDWTKAIR